jgi:hypothetical protein
MNTKFLMSFFIFCFAAGLGYSSTTFAQDKGRGFKKFHRGVCVGQTLAQEGIILPPHQPGQRPAWDATTKAAFKAAIQTCRAQYKGPGQGSPVNTTPTTPTAPST